jgi:signal transduction histidine kinase
MSKGNGVIKGIRDTLRGLFTSLRAKVIFTVIVVLFVMTGLSGYVWFYYWREQLIELTENQISLLFQSVELSIDMAMKEGKQSEIQDILKRIALRDEILNLRIYNTEGVIMRSSNEEEEGTHPTDIGKHEAINLGSLRLTSLRAGNGGNLRLMYPIKKREVCVTCHQTDKDYIGVLEMDISLQDVRDIISHNRDRMVFFTIITALMLSLTVAYLFEREVHTPISSIVETMNEVEAGNLSARIRLENRDELGLIAHSLNSMVGKLENAIGEIKRYHEQELKKSKRLAAIGELAASISHEIRNPLAGIKGAIQVILKDENISQRHVEVLTEVLTQVDRLNGTVSDLLTFSRPLVPVISYSEIVPVIDRTLDPLKLKPHLGDVEIVKDYDKAGIVQMDPNLMEQAFFNIVINSLQAMGGRGRLEVSVREDDDATLICFEDNGAGIAPENLEKIFRPFFTTKHRGTGLGLSISRNIVEAHGGTIRVDSEPGRGTKFVIRLPKVRHEDV